MTPSARIQAVIDLTSDIAQSLESQGSAADVMIRKYFRSRRYAGSRDRRTITNMIYQMIRQWGGLSALSGTSVRKMVITQLCLNEEQSTQDINALFSGADYAPDVLNDEEQVFLKELRQLKEKPDLSVLPDWIMEKFKDRFGDELDTALAAIKGRAPFTLRVNALKANRSDVLKQLSEQDIDCRPGELTDHSIHLSEQVQIRDWPLYQKGQVEIQDESSQLAASLSDCQPGMQVLDLCAGGGGKTLAIASGMKNKGQIYAFDINAPRLKSLRARANRAGAHIIQARELSEKNEQREKVLSEYAGKMDRVILDVPCSGSGTWRRNPEGIWRTKADDIQDYVAIQSQILQEGWACVKPGGRMVYMTCSLFADENEEQILNFIKQTRGARVIPTDMQGNTSSDDGFLQLTPHLHGSDGFFIAILEKQP